MIDVCVCMCVYVRGSKKLNTSAITTRLRDSNDSCDISQNSATSSFALQAFFKTIADRCLSLILIT